MILKIAPGASFARAKAISAFVNTDLLLIMKMVAKRNSRTLYCYSLLGFSHQVCEKCDWLEKFINMSHSSQDHLKTVFFKKNGICPVTMGASLSKRKSWNIWTIVLWVLFFCLFALVCGCSSPHIFLWGGFSKTEKPHSSSKLKVKLSILI